MIEFFKNNFVLVMFFALIFVWNISDVVLKLSNPTANCKPEVHKMDDAFKTTHCAAGTIVRIQDNLIICGCP